VKEETSDTLHQTVLSTNEQRQYYRDKILQLRNFDEAFELVEKAVDAKFRMHRAGLSLVLQALPTNLGACHVLGSNMHIVNRRILDTIKTRLLKNIIHICLWCYAMNICIALAS
jgi:hypothetical protein